VIIVELAPPPPQWPPMVDRQPRRRVLVPLTLFIATCISTVFAGGWPEALEIGQRFGVAAGLRASLLEGLKYAVPVMTILLCHELGHFLQARRYGVYASFPYFIPMPFSSIGTFGAVIGMDARMGHRRALFDIGITGPLAGLLPSLAFCVVGLQWSYFGPPPKDTLEPALGSSLLFSQLVALVKGQAGAGEVLHLHPMAFAAWVGLLITSVNLLPIGQLDGGHILYALLRRKAQTVGTLFLVLAIGLVIYFGLWIWTVMLLFLLWMGPVHPPTANDDEPLGAGRIVLGWAMLAFIPFGIPPVPFLLLQQ
jgi:membrane-associated protease RseP (regulator of RpoE activity)